ncbi:hypothetical protein BJY01DRAFT_37069 [Aspergillus pseudoustus]|uniref:Uncharacterized protein n=1 Tax=Aspergillus pseudoustus TaxID=1810923 RepID=A0ABR4KQ24_9EURO
MSSRNSPKRRTIAPNSASRSRSRSPTRSSRHSRHRQRNEYDHDRHDRRRHSRSYSRRWTHDWPSKSIIERELPVPIVLPFNARQLSKRDLGAFETMFAMYLDIQKGLLLEDLSDDEVKGRWKSFIGKWNRGELAEGWYDPSTLEKAQKSVAATGPRESPVFERPADDVERDLKPARHDGHGEDDDDDDDDEHGPMPHYGLLSGGGGLATGPTIPTMQDLELRNEIAMEDSMTERYDARQQRRTEVRSHKAELRLMEEEVAPRAEPGTHERKMEKRREAATANRAFADARRGGSPEAAPDDELMGSGENDLEAVKSARERARRKKNEREIRREEILRARTAEREERVKRYKEKEEETIGWLKTLAKQRFG